MYNVASVEFYPLSNNEIKETNKEKVNQKTDCFYALPDCNLASYVLVSSDNAVGRSIA